jgi:hypothetical protein
MAGSGPCSDNHGREAAPSALDTFNRWTRSLGPGTVRQRHPDQNRAREHHYPREKRPHPSATSERCAVAPGVCDHAFGIELHGVRVSKGFPDAHARRTPSQRTAHPVPPSPIYKPLRAPMLTLTGTRLSCADQGPGNLAGVVYSRGYPMLSAVAWRRCPKPGALRGESSGERCAPCDAGSRGLISMRRPSARCRSWWLRARLGSPLSQDGPGRTGAVSLAGSGVRAVHGGRRGCRLRGSFRTCCGLVDRKLLYARIARQALDRGGTRVYLGCRQADSGARHSQRTMGVRLPQRAVGRSGPCPKIPLPSGSGRVGAIVVDLWPDQKMTGPGHDRSGRGAPARHPSTRSPGCTGD